MKHLYTVYQTVNLVNGNIYIGKHKTTDPNDNYIGSGKRLKIAIKKYGIHNFKKEVLFIFDNEDEMNAKEKELVTPEFLMREDVYNLCSGGNGGFGYINSSNIPKFKGKRHSEETKAIIGAKSKGRVGGMKGKKLSEESRKLIGENSRRKLTGKPRSEETKKRISETMKRRASYSGDYIWLPTR